MISKRGQANIIVILGMVAATIFVLYNAFTYINYVGMSSQIETVAQTSIYQSLAQKDYLVQQANYLFDKAQLFDALNLQPIYSGNSVNCGYINASTRLPFIPVDKIYYWDNLAGNTCLPDNQELLFGLEHLLNQSQFSAVNSSGLDITSYLDLNLTKTNTGMFAGNFSAPYLQDIYKIIYDPINAAVAVYNENQSYYVFNGSIGLTLNLNGSRFVINPPSDIISGLLSQTVARSSFFSGAGLAPDAQFSLITFKSGSEAVIYDSRDSSGQPEFFITPLVDPNVYTLASAMSKDTAVGVPDQIEVYNNSAFDYLGTWYTFTVTSYPNGAFAIYPDNYTILPLQPDFVYYKYLINEFQTSGSQNLLFPNNGQLSVSISLFPLYNPQVCASYNEIQFTLTNCISVSGYLTTSDYLSTLMQMGIAFVNNTFPVNNGNVTGFAQYALDNYLNNAAHVVNMKTVSVNGQPKYDWYSAMLFALGSPNGASYLINELSRVAEPYYGTTVYNCSQSESDIQFCRNLLSQTASADLKNLFQDQIPIELGFLSGTPFNINVLNLSANFSEADTCPPYGGYTYNDYNSSVNYSFSIKSQVSGNFSEETIGIPISLDFGYVNRLRLTPSEICGIQNDPYKTGYPGFSQTLVSLSKTYLNCAPLLARQFLNTTCIAYVETGNAGVEKYEFSNFDSAQPYGYERWFTEGNSCPSYVVIDGQNFTYSSNKYRLISMQGGGAVPSKDGPDNWSMVSYNNSILPLPQNISVYTGVVMSGPDPSFNLILSQYQNLQNGFSYVQMNPSSSTDSVFSYGPKGETELASYPAGSASGVLMNMQVNVYGSVYSGYNLNFYADGIEQASISNVTGWFRSGIKGVHFIGLSTDFLPTEDSIPYMFVTNYVEGYSPVNTVYSFEPASTLNPSLQESFGLSSTNSTYYNMIALNQLSLSSAYQAQILLDQNYNYGALSLNSLRIFGVYKSGAVEQMYWWNQTPLQLGGTVWVNLSSSVPQTLYVVYGNGITSANEYTDNASYVFPLFFSNTTGKIASIFNYYKYEPPSPAPELSVGGVGLIKTGPVYPFIYNSSLSSYYGQFACITISPSLSITVLNATYSPYRQISYTSNYNPLYPDLQVLNSQSYDNWGSVMG